jgi:heat shock protein HslJ
MKKAISIFLGFLCLALVVNCSAVGVQNREIQRQWMMISFKNFTKEQLVKSKSEINLTSAIKDGKIQGTAFMGCNRMFFTAEIKSKNKIEFSGIGSTLMACENMKLEDEFSKELKKMKNYTVEGHFLTVTDNKGSIMRFIAADWD